jgi:hypothetical protein
MLSKRGSPRLRVRTIAVDEGAIHIEQHAVVARELEVSRFPARSNRGFFEWKGHSVTSYAINWRLVMHVPVHAQWVSGQ